MLLNTFAFFISRFQSSCRHIRGAGTFSVTAVAVCGEISVCWFMGC